MFLLRHLFEVLEKKFTEHVLNTDTVAAMICCHDPLPSYKWTP